MLSPNSKILALTLAGLLVIGLPVYGVYSTRTAVNGRIAALEQELQTVRTQDAARIEQLSADLKFIADKMDITAHDLEQSRALAEKLKRDNAQSTQRLRSEIASHSPVTGSKQKSIPLRGTGGRSAPHFSLFGRIDPPRSPLAI